MAGYTYADYQDPYGLDAADDVTPKPRAPKPQSWQQQNALWQQNYQNAQAHFQAAFNRNPGNSPQVPTIVNRPAPPPSNLGQRMAQWKQQVASKPPAAPKPQPVQQASSVPPIGIKTSPPSQAPQPEPPKDPQMFTGQHANFAGQHAPFAGQLQQHMQNHKDMVSGVNNAVANSSRMMTEAAARNQVLAHHQQTAAAQNNLEMEKIRSQERMMAAERQDKNQRRQAVMGMLGMPTVITNHPSLLSRSLLG